MSENIKKRNYYDKEIVNRLREKFGVSGYFIRASLRGDRKSETSEKIVKEYARLNKRVAEILKEDTND